MRKGVGVGHLPHGPHHGAEGATPEIDLGLREVERVLALDRTGRHVVADRIAHDIAPSVYHQGYLGLGYVQSRVRPHCHRAAIAYHPPRRRLEEQLGPVGVVDELVRIRSPLALFDTGFPRYLVGNATGPYLGTAVDRRQYLDLFEREPRATGFIDEPPDGTEAERPQLRQRRRREPP